MQLITLGLSNMQAEAPLYDMASVKDLLGDLRTNSGQRVSQATALRASAVLACIRILMEDISQLPLRLHRAGPRGATLATDHPLYRLLDSSPNHWQTSMELREGMILDMLLFGGSYVEKIITRKGITALYPLSASRMSFRDVLPNGVARWTYAQPPNTMAAVPTAPEPHLRVLLEDDLWRCSLMAPAGYLEGRSLILLAREAIGLALAAEEQGARLFSNGLQTGIVVKTQDNLGPEERGQLKSSFTDAYTGTSNFFKPLLLEGGLDVSKIGLTAQESQYIESRSFQLQEIARIFRIPEVLLGISQGKTSTYASAEQFFNAYVKHTIAPWVRRIEQTISRDLLAPSESDLFAKHNLDALLRADLQTRYNAHKTGIESGFLTRNEARLDEPIFALNMGNRDSQPANPAKAFARQLAKNAVGHEMKLLADGKGRADVYGKLLPGYLGAKTGLPASLCAEYCQARLSAEAGEQEGIELLAGLLTRV